MSIMRFKMILTLFCLLVAGLPALAVTLDEATLRELVEVHMRQQLFERFPAEKPAHLRVEVGRVPLAPLTFADAARIEDLTIEIESPLSKMYTNRMVARISVRDESGYTRQMGVPVELWIKKPVWVVKNSVSAGEPLKAGNLALQVRDVSRDYTHVAGAELSLKTYVARVNLRPGDMLDTRKIEIPPDVSRNDEIRIVMSNGQGMTITVPGIALSDGKIGERIQVRQSLNQKRKTFTAEVINRNQVLVNM